MPKKPAHLSRSGNSARGAARINASDDVPNTNSTEFAEKFSGKASTRDLMGDPSDSENEDPSPQKNSYSAVARELKRPLREQRGVGHGQGKHPRTLVRRLMGMFEVMAAEQRKRAEYERLAQMCLEAICDPEMHISPQCDDGLPAAAPLDSTAAVLLPRVAGRASPTFPQVCYRHSAAESFFSMAASLFSMRADRTDGRRRRRVRGKRAARVFTGSKSHDVTVNHVVREPGWGAAVPGQAKLGRVWTRDSERCQLR